MTKPKCTGEIDQEYWKEADFVIGVDEAGRGPLAGDMFVAAVCFPASEIKTISEIGLNDSKKLTNKRRFFLEPSIKESALKFSVRRVTVKTINKGESLQALLDRCVKITVRDIVRKLNTDNVIVLADGFEIDDLPYRQIARPKMDSISWSVAAASILAKNAQVRSMQKLHEKYPHYNFNEHNGYGTDTHRAAIVEHGPCEAHRSSWLTEEKIKKWSKKSKVKQRYKADRQRPKMI